VNDPSVTAIVIEAARLEHPAHDIWFVYNNYDELNVPHMEMVRPEFAPVEVLLSSADGNEDSMKPTVFTLHQNSPNPFNPSTRISFDLPASSHVKLDIFNMLGRHVVTLVDGIREAGAYSVTWDGTTSTGDKAASGIYFYRLKTDEFTETKKMMMLK
jgi:hypothetical protein